MLPLVVKSFVLFFPLDAPGITRRPIGRLDGKPAFAELFFDDVFVPDSDVIGSPGDGWRVAMATTGNERGLQLRSPGRFTAASTGCAASITCSNTLASICYRPCFRSDSAARQFLFISVLS